MKKLLILVLLLMGSNAWAQDSTMTPNPQETTSATTSAPSPDSTAMGTPAIVTDSSSQASNAQAAVTDLGAQSSPTASWTEVPHSTAVAEMASESPTPTSVSTVMPKPPVLSVVSTPVPSNPVGEHFVFQLDGGIAPAISQAAATVFGSGFGFDARLSYAFDDVFSIGLETGFYDMGVAPAVLSSAPGDFDFPAGAVVNMSHIPLLLTMQIYFGDSGAPIQPYLLLAGGFSFDAYNLQGAPYTPGVNYSWMNFELDPAVGVAFRLDSNMNVFVQAKYAMDFGSNTGSGAESADSPIILLPIQAGLNFNL